MLEKCIVCLCWGITLSRRVRSQLVKKIPTLYAAIISHSVERCRSVCTSVRPSVWNIVPVKMAKDAVEILSLLGSSGRRPIFLINKPRCDMNADYSVHTVHRCAHETVTVLSRYLGMSWGRRRRDIRADRRTRNCLECWHIHDCSRRDLSRHTHQHLHTYSSDIN